MNEKLKLISRDVKIIKRLKTVSSFLRFFSVLSTLTGIAAVCVDFYRVITGNIKKRSALQDRL